MTDLDRLIAHVGDRLVHVTAASNVASIQRHGLLPAAEIARRAGTAPARLALREARERVRFGAEIAVLNHQLPILHGRKAAERMLDGHTPESWAAALDERVFFSTDKRNADFARSIAADLEIATLHVATRPLFERLGHRLDLSPLNSGNFKQGGANAARGDWIYVPWTDGFDAFRRNRRDRGLVSSMDPVREISLVGAISADDFAACLI